MPAKVEGHRENSARRLPRGPPPPLKYQLQDDEVVGVKVGAVLFGWFVYNTCIVQDTIPISSMISREFAVPNQRATNVNRVLLIVSYDGIPRDFVILIALLSPIRR